MELNIQRRHVTSTPQIEQLSVDLKINTYPSKTESIMDNVSEIFGPIFVRAYLRASTTEQDASRAGSQLDAFAAEHGVAIATRYVEN